MLEYLEGYAAHHALDVRLETEVERIDREDGGWRVSTSRGELEAEVVVVATGYDRAPFVPAWPGRERFPGTLSHASEYRNPEPYRGRDVLVVGPGCSGAEIAHDLAQGGAGRVWLSVRTPPHIVLRSIGGVPADLLAVLLYRSPHAVADRLGRFFRRITIGNLTPYGLPTPSDGLFSRSRRTGMPPATVDRKVIQAIKRRRIEIVPAVEGFDGGEALLAGGARVAPDAVVAATGYRRALEPLVGHLGVLDAAGCPVVSGGPSPPDAPGLHFIGYNPAVSGPLRHIRLEAGRLARAVAADSELEAPRVPATAAVTAPA
jgi:putative flavoprotein involved in K+ transport